MGIAKVGSVKADADASGDTTHVYSNWIDTMPGVAEGVDVGVSLSGLDEAVGAVSNFRSRERLTSAMMWRKAVMQTWNV